VLANKEIIIKRRLFNFIYTIYPDSKESEKNICLFLENLKKEKVQNILDDIDAYFYDNKMKYKKEFKYYEKFTFKENLIAYKKYVLKEKLIILKKYIFDLKKYITNGGSI
jgi:hypothetical protein